MKIYNHIHQLSKLIFFSILALLILLISACAGKPKDNLAPYRNMTEAQIFEKGEKELKKKHYKQASQIFAALDALYPFGTYAQQASLDNIYANYKKGDTASGLAETDRYIRLYPRSPQIDYVYYMKGLLSDQPGLSWMQQQIGIDPAEHDLSSKKQAFLAFNEVVTRFPTSPYAPNSALRMIQIRNLLAHKQVMLADFYFKHKAYLAAANRASYVVHHFQGSPEVIKALAILIKSYRAAGLDHLADMTFKVMATSYPNAKELKDLKNTKP